MRVTNAKKALGLSMLIGFISSSLIIIHVVLGSTTTDDDHHENSIKYNQEMNQMKSIKTTFLRRNLVSIPAPLPSISPSPSLPPQQISPADSRVYKVTAYGADPTGKTDSTKALQQAFLDAFNAAATTASGNDRLDEFLMQGITDLGGPQINLEGGSYMISSPLHFPPTGGGNLVIHGGSIRASESFPKDGYLIQLSASSSSSRPSSSDVDSENKDIKQKNGTSTSSKKADNGIEQELASSAYAYEYITIKDVMLDANYTGGGISVINSLRTTIDNCYISHFTTDGILVQGGHETYIHNSFLGQHITAGGDPGEKNFGGTGINIMGNDNAVTDVVIFSAEVGIRISGQANILTGVHCYNKATGWGGTGIFLTSAGSTQTRIVNSYLDFTGIVAEDPSQLHISNTFFLGDGYILLKSSRGEIHGVNIVDNMFSGSGKGIDIVQLDQSKSPFTRVDQIVVDRNNVRGMNLRSTVGKGSIQGNGSSWSLDFNGVLLFPNLIKHVQYTLSTSTGLFPNHALTNVTGNRVVVESDKPIAAKIFVTVEQSSTIDS
ncbi:hypothetical protein MKW94_015488 [Papaver nudicaule]|uniref:Pectate lyase superfamily protein domain-containing protein n=1 Tax=Papaver nudicaule TaxID=74823 RepID=A0AA41V5B5_PAPNU|nr:hypothetical protein [Papaver nudicaule]